MDSTKEYLAVEPLDVVKFDRSPRELSRAPWYEADTEKALDRFYQQQLLREERIRERSLTQRVLHYQLLERLRTAWLAFREPWRVNWWA